jgi:hypothetical protein
MYNTTDEQQAVINNLEKKGFRETGHYQSDEDGDCTVFLVKSVKHSHYHAEVESSGDVNGKPLAEYLEWLKAAMKR